jgi:hypothetical protein
MAIVPSLPSNGQPIDTQYLYDIVNSLISINNAISTTGSSSIQVGATKSTAVTGNLKFDAKTVNVVKAGSDVTESTINTGQISFTSQFNQIPVVTATLVAKSNTTVKSTLTITGVDTSAVYYQVTHSGKGKTNLDANIIAIGL